MFKKLSAAVLTAGMAMSASAADFFIDRGTDWSLIPDGDSVTANIKQLGITGTLATSYYFGLPAPGTVVIDTNVAAAMAGTFASGNYLSINGTPVTLNNTPSFGERDVDSLNPLVTGLNDTEGYGFPLGYRFFYEYTLLGAVNAAGNAVDFTSGFFNLFMVDLNLGGVPQMAGARQVMRVNVTGSLTQAANLNVFGNVDYSWCDPVPGCSTEVQNLFNDVATNDSFFNIWKSSTPPPVISFVLDTNVDPPVPTASQLVALADCSALGAGPVGCLVRQTTLDSSVTFAVPEPGSLALIGLGALGLGLRRRKPRAA